MFAKVAGAWSFSSAARDLGISQAREQPRTNAGEGFFIQCSRILEELDAALVKPVSGKAGAAP